MPFSPAVAANVNVADVAPAKFVNVVPPFVLTCHCTLGTGDPVADAINVALTPAITVTFAGFTVITGAVLTVSVADDDVTLLTEFVNTASYKFPFCEIVVVKFNAVEVAPATAVKLAPSFVLTIHCTVGTGVPVAVAVNVAVAAAVTVMLAGCAVIAGAVLVLIVLVAAQPPIHTTAINIRALSIVRAADALSPIHLKFCLKF